MIEKTVQDRVPTYAGRVTLTPVEGAANTFTMERADVPVVEGTPIDRALFDSITQSRLTGRYYAPSVSREVMTSTTGTTDPIPESGWTELSYTEFTNNSYKLTASFPDYPNLPTRAVDASATTYYAAESDTGETWIAIDFGTRILVNKIRVQWFSYDYDYFNVSFQGSNDGTTWTTIASTTGNRETATDWNVNSTVEYSQYRLLFKQGTENAMRLYDWSITGWSVNVYKNVFNIPQGLPSEWSEGQRITIKTPSGINTVGVLYNFLNGVKIDTILLSNRTYELVYSGTSFKVKEI